MKCRIILCFLLAASVASAYLSYPFLSGSFMHDDLTLLVFDGIPALGLSPITQNEYPDLVKFNLQIRAGGKTRTLSDPSGSVADVEKAHYAPGGKTLYWWGNEDQWRVQMEILDYQPAGLATAYWDLGYVIHLLQDTTVPAHSRVVFHGSAIAYSYVFPGGPVLGSPPAGWWRPRADCFEYAASRMRLADLRINYGVDYNTMAFRSPMCGDFRKFWIDDSSDGDPRDNWGAYGEPYFSSNCSAKPLSASDNDWFPDQLLGCSSLSVDLPGGPLDLVRGGLSQAAVLTYNELTSTSKKLKPLLSFTTVPPTSINFSSGNLVVDFEVQENRTASVRLNILHRPTGKYVINNALQSLGNLDMQDLTKLPYHQVFRLPWDGTLADGSKVSPGNQQQLVFQAYDMDGNASDPRSVTFSVYGAAPPTIATSPATLSFTADQGTNPASQSIAVANAGAGTLAFTATATTAAGGSWLVVSPTSGATPATMQVSVNSANLATGTYGGTIAVASTSPGVTNSPQTVPVSLTVHAVGSGIALSQTTLTFTANQGTSPLPQSFTVNNSSGGTLAWTASATTTGGGNWLSVIPASGSAGNWVQVTVISAALAPGTYTGTISVASSSAGVTNSPQVVSVSLIVQPGLGGACCGPEPSLSVTVDPGFYIASSTIQAGGAEGYWEMSVEPQKDQRGGGFIFGGGIQEKGMTPYFAAFLLSSPQEVLIQLNPRLLPGGDASKFSACARLLDGKRQQIGTERCSTGFIEFRQTLPPDFYIIEVRTGALSPGAYFEFLLGERNLPAGLIVGGFLSSQVPGFIAFSVTQRQEVRIKAAGRCAFGAFAARCLRLTLYDSNRNIVAVSGSAGGAASLDLITVADNGTLAFPGDCGPATPPR